ncbi:TonB-dependent receptor [Azonexus sp.]|uniref:TonB-dependent receptor plug domain-containing protein n=1 Tax=Azonexus sp. TaxID=1872668 RepID=UPI002822F556|nr:TonB-dependent receptor [Azonexus sp.]MDR1994815.1 TonB-dependent receptor [Azonexus sp.]
MQTRLKPVAALLLPLFAGNLYAQSSPESRETPTTLGEVVVTANRMLEAKSEVSSNITVINSADIRASTATSVADLLTQNGFHVVTMGDTSNVQIRGMGNLTMTNEMENQVLILLNGRRAGMSNLALAGLANVDRVEIIRGSSAVQYGSSALGGVINIITKRGDAARPFASVEVGIGSDSLQRQKIALGGAANGFDFAFGGTHESRDDMTYSGGHRWYNTAVDRDQNYNLDLGYTFYKNHRIGINRNEGEIKSDLPAYDYTCPSDGIRPSQCNTPNSLYNKHFKRNTNNAFSYTGATDEKNLDWMFNYSSGKDKQNIAYPDTGIKSYSTAIDIKALNAQVNYNASLYTLSAGVDRYKYDVSGWDEYSGDMPDGTMKNTGAYLTGKLRLLDERLVFSLGLRHDRFENSSDILDTQKKSHTGGSAGVSYLPLDWLKLRANYADGFRMASPQQIGGGYYYSSNLSLKPEESKTWEFGTDVNWKSVSASLTWFHSDWKDRIIALYDPAGTCGSGWCYQYQNLKKSEVAGFEGSVSWDIGKAFEQGYSLKPYLGFTWLTTRKNKDPAQYIAYRGESNIMPNTPKWMVSYGIDYAHPGLKLKSRLNANYYGKALTQDFSGTVSMPPGDTYFERPSGTVVNWSLEKELVDIKQVGKLTLRAEVSNLFDQANEVYWNYPGPGRNFYLGLRYDYF